MKPALQLRISQQLTMTPQLQQAIRRSSFVVGVLVYSKAELEGYKVRVRAQNIAQAERNSTLADALARAQILQGDWREFFREQERVQALTVADLTEAMRRSLVKRNRTVAMIVNPPAQAANEGGR